MRIFLAIAAFICTCAVHATDLNQQQYDALQQYGTKAAWNGAQAQALVQSTVNRLDRAKQHGTVEEHKWNQLLWWLQQASYEKNAQGEKFERNIALAGQDFADIDSTLQVNGCSQAPLISNGVFQSQLNGPGAVWIQIDAPVSGALHVSTVGSEMDTRIAVYDQCPSETSESVVTKDDDVGLYAEYTTTGGARLTKRQWLAIRGDVPGRLQVRVALTGESISGQLNANISSTLSWYTVRLYIQEQNYFSFASSVEAYAPAYEYTVSLNALAGARYVLLAGNTAFNNTTHLPRLYPNAACINLSFNSPACDQQNATRFVFTAGQQFTGINMVLDSGGKFTGRLIGSGPLRNSALTAYHVDSGTGTIIFQRVVSTDQTGRYELAGLMPNLRYALRGQADLHSMTLYPNVPCDPNQGCNLLLAGLVFPGAYNISIIPIPQLKINISPSMQVSGTVVIYDKSGAVQYQYLNGSGPFRVSLGQGNNYVSLHIEGYQALLYGASACVPSSDGQSCANFLDGMPILGSSDQEIDVSLEALPKISGRIVGGKGEMYVRACRGNFSCFDGTVNYDGTYIFNRVHPGAYYIEARGNEIVDTLFPNVPCQLSQNTRCNPELTNAQVVTVGLNDVPDINISVARTGSISGLLNPSNVGIELFKEGDISGIYGTYYIGTNNYLINDLLPGTYRARIAPGSYNFGQVFPGVNCAASCAFSQGQAILVTGNLISSNVNFMPASKNVISGVVRNAENMPIAFMPVDIFRINTTTNLLTRDGAVLTDSQGRYQYFSSSFQNGYAYILATDSENYQNMVYQSVLCARGTSMYLGTCLASGATRLTLPATAPGQFENINFQLGVVDELFSGGFEDLTR